MIDRPDRMPPQNIEAEQGVLGSVLMDGEVFPDVVRVLVPADFFRDTHQIVFQAMCDVFAAGSPINVLSVTEELVRGGHFKAVGGTEALASFVEAVPHSVNAAYYAGVVKQKSTSRATIALASQMLADGYSNNFTAEELVGRAMAGLLALQESGRMRAIQPLAEMVGPVIYEIDGRRHTKVSGLLTGFTDLDYNLGGMKPEQLIVLAGRPSMGKSALGLNICENVAERGVPVLFISLEMSGSSLVERMIVSRARIDSHRAAVGALDGESLGRAVTAAEELQRLPVYFDDSPSMSILQVIAAARSVALRHKVGLVVLDYLQLVESENSKEPRHEQVGKMSRRLKQLARELGVPVLALSQLNRQCEGREDKKPRMSDLRESGSVEQDADIVLLIHRPEYYDPEQKPGVAEVIVAKNRNGRTGSVDLVFLREQMRFGSLGVDPVAAHAHPNDQPF